MNDLDLVLEDAAGLTELVRKELRCNWCYWLHRVVRARPDLFVADQDTLFRIVSRAEFERCKLQGYCPKEYK